ncbi:MAG: hypothetical protein GY856_40125 [bacterium]|nr:hypothetical protein [bacterium]
MKQSFSDFVRSLDPTGEPTPAAFDELWTKLRGVLRRELRRRGLWERSPSHLGVTGCPTWTMPETSGVRGAPAHTRDALDELTVDCYVEVFVRRLDSLRRYLRDDSGIEGVVVHGIRQFLHDLQQHYDPLGFRLFQRLRAALLRAVEARRLYVLEGGTKIHNQTVFGFRPEAEAALARDEPLAQEVRRWNDELLLDWVTARGEAVESLVGRLETCVLGLAEAGIEVFGLKALIDAVKRDVRTRIAALWAGRDPSQAMAPEEAPGEVDWEDPLEQTVERDRIRELSECVESGLPRLKVQGRTREQLRKLWRFLEAFALTAADPESARGSDEALAAALERDTLPSNRELSRLLGIRHDRFPALFARLKGEVERCVHMIREAPKTASLGGSVRSCGAEPRLDKNRDLRHELRRLTAEAYRREVETPPAANGPKAGDLYSLAASPEPGVEWLVLEVEPGTDRYLVVAVDTVSWIGTSDVAVTDEATVGPLSMRCGHGIRLDPEVLRSGRSSGAVGEFDLARARTRRRQLLAGEVPSTTAEREVDADPDYRDWCRTLESARQAVCKALGGRLAEIPESAPVAVHERERKKGRPVGRLLAMAASIVVVLFGGFMAGRLVEQGRPDPRVAELEEANRRIEGDRDALAQRIETERVEFEDERQLDQSRHQEEMAAIEQRFKDELAQVDRPEVGVPWLLIASGSTRGDSEELVVPSGTRSVVLSTNAERGDRIELRVRGGKAIWSTTVETDLDDEFVVRLPATLMPPGEYEVLVWRKGKRISYYPFRVERP